MDGTGGTERRAATDDDAAAVLDLMLRWDAVYLGHPDTDLDDVTTLWSTEGFDRDRDTLLLLRAGRAAAYGVRVDPVDFHLWVDPDAAGDGLEEELVSWALRRGAELAAARPDGTAASPVLVQAAGEDAALRGALEAAGFAAGRVYVQLRIALDDPPPPPTWPDGVALRPFDRAAHAPAVHALIADAFADVTGWRERPFAWFDRVILGRTTFDPSLVFCAWAGDRLVGAAVTFDFADYGYVWYLAVDRSARGRGLGRALLRQSFAAHRARGLPRTELSVDSENDTGAFHLYTSVGMAEVHRDLYYERPAG